MKKILITLNRARTVAFTIIASTLTWMFSLSGAQAGLITEWTFTGDTTAALYGANILGSGVVSATLTPSDASEIISTTADDGNPAPSLKLSGGTAINDTTITLALTINAQTVFSTGATLAFDYQNSSLSTSATSIAWTYSVNGGSSASLGSLSLSGNTEMINNSLSLSSIGVVNSGSSIDFVGTPDGALMGTSSTYFDNFEITAVPEPATWGAMSAAGLFGICGLREWRQRRQQKTDII